MRWTHAAAVVLSGLVLLTPTAARADDADVGQRAAGWAVLGIGSSIGLGSIASGITLIVIGGSQNQEVGSATLIGGAVTTGVALVIGVPLILTARGSDSKHADARFLDALSGRFRW